MKITESDEKPNSRLFTTHNEVREKERGYLIMQTKPIIYQPGFVPAELYSGVPSFMGMPVAHTPEEVKSFDFAVMGVPWEGGCTYGGFSSCVISPKTVRAVSTRYTGYLPDYDLDIFDYMTTCDYGDIPVQNGNYELTFSEMRKKFGEIIDAGAIPITFGGDHSISYPMISEMAKRHKKRVGVLHFDAHLDTMPSFGDDLYSRCSPFDRLYQDENIDPTKVVHIGIRGPRNHPQERKEAKKYGATVITGMEIKKNGYEASVQKAIEIASKDTDVLYVTVCSDVLDAASNPQGPVDPCGLTSFELAMMLHACGEAGANAFDFVEIYPETCGPQPSAHTAVWMSLYFMNGLAGRKANGEKNN